MDDDDAKDSRWTRFLRHPAGVLVSVVALSMALEDRWFPFTNFPMYSDLPPRTSYFYLADGAGEPIALRPHFNTTTTRMKKRFRSLEREVTERTGKRRRDLTGAEHEAIGIRVLEHARSLRLSDDSESPASGTLRLVRVDLELVDGELERNEVLVAESAP